MCKQLQTKFLGISAKVYFFSYLSCIYFDPKCIFGTNLAKLGLLISTIELKDCNPMFFHSKTCKGQMYWEWSVYHIVEDLRDYFHTHFLEPLDYFFCKT